MYTGNITKILPFGNSPRNFELLVPLEYFKRKFPFFSIMVGKNLGKF